MKALPILYQDDRIVAVNKPAGLLVHKSPIDRRETEFAMKILRNQLGRWVYPLHRLDKATSGVLLFALDPEAARRMTEVFTAGAVSKTYLAVVRGYTDEGGRIDHPLHDPRDKHAPPTECDKPAREAVTDYRRLATIELPHPVGRYATARYSLIAASPLTGRTHQIRRHLKHIFHPLIGDTTYGDGRQNEFFRSQLQCFRLLLHARSIEFDHPVAGEKIRVSAPLDEAFSAVVHAFVWVHAVESNF